MYCFYKKHIYVFINCLQFMYYWTRCVFFSRIHSFSSMSLGCYLYFAAIALCLYVFLSKGFQFQWLLHLKVGLFARLSDLLFGVSESCLRYAVCSHQSTISLNVNSVLFGSVVSALIIILKNKVSCEGLFTYSHKWNGTLELVVFC